MAYLPEVAHPVAPVAPRGSKAARAAVAASAARRGGMGNSPAYVGSMFPGDGLGDDGLGFIQAIPAIASAGSSIIKGISSIFGGGGPNPRIALAQAQLACVKNYGDITAARVILMQKDKGATADGRAAYQSAWNTIVSQYPAIAAQAQALGPASDDTRRPCTIATAPQVGAPGALPAPALTTPAINILPNVQPMAPAGALVAPAPVPAPVAVPTAITANPQLAAAAQQIQARRAAAAQVLAQTNAQMAQVQQQIASLQAAQAQAAASGTPVPAAASSSTLDQLTQLLDNLSQQSQVAAGAVNTIDSGFQQLGASTSPDQSAAILAGLNQQTAPLESYLGSVSTKSLLLLGGGALAAWFLTRRSGRRAA